VRLTVGLLPTGVLGSYRGRENMITISQALLNEDPRTQSTVLGHELIHAQQAFDGYGGRLDCVGREVEAHMFEAAIWASHWKGNGPARTRTEVELNNLLKLLLTEGEPGLYKYVVENPGYEEQCKLWVP
jgi:hypothetical protein